MSKYTRLHKIAEGGFGDIYVCRHEESHSQVAEKWIALDNKHNGLPCLVLREISVLKELDHPNVVRLLDVIPPSFKEGEGTDTPTGFTLIFEYLEYDLNRFIKDSTHTIDPHTIKGFLFQILQGVAYCHSQKVLHRDLKPHNLLLDLETMTLKLADFGYARTFDVPRSQYSTEVATLSYKAPELLLGLPYTTAVDIWSVGCIFAEMVKREPLFTASIDTICMNKIMRMLGVPKERDWPGGRSACKRLFDTEAMPFDPVMDLAQVVTGIEPEGFDLLSKMLCMTPSRRITAHDALRHPYFKDFELNQGSVSL